jgi:hypothetical protein
MRKALSTLSMLALALAPLSAAPRQTPTQDQQPQTQAQPQAQAQPQPQDAAAKLTNKDVLEMLKANLTPAVVIAKIKSSANSFDTSPAALQELKAASVPDDVILTMVQASSAVAAAPPTGTAAVEGEAVEVKVPDGTEVEIELKNNVSGQEVKVGDIVDFTVLRPVQVGGVTIIDKGASARARITTAKKAGHWGHAGKLQWAMQDVQAIDGNRLPARFTKRDVGDSKGGTVAVAAVATTVLLGPVGLLWGLKKGKPAIIPAGNRYTVFVHGDAAVKGKAALSRAAQ